jgi:hypothetical protein
MRVIVKLTDELEECYCSSYCQICANEDAKYYLRRSGLKIGENCKNKFTEATL